MIDRRWKCVAPGLYVDESANVVHLFLEELLEVGGVPVNARNLAIIESAAREKLAIMFPQTPIVCVEGGEQ